MEQLYTFLEKKLKFILRMGRTWIDQVIVFIILD